MLHCFCRTGKICKCLKTYKYSIDAQYCEASLRGMVRCMEVSGYFTSEETQFERFSAVKYYSSIYDLIRTVILLILKHNHHKHPNISSSSVIILAFTYVM